MRRFLAVLLLYFTVAAPVAAAIVSGTYSFSIQNSGSIDPFNGSFDITFDNSADIIDTNSGLSNVVLPAAMGGVSVGYWYDSLSDQLTFGGLSFSVGVLDAGAPADFAVYIQSASTNARNIDTFGYLLQNDASGNNGGFTVSQLVFTPTPVPLPAAAWLLLSGLGGLGFVARRRKAA